MQRVANMIVHVTSSTEGMIIESTTESPNFRIQTPHARTLLARMNGAKEKRFLAEMKNGSLEIGDEVKPR